MSPVSVERTFRLRCPRLLAATILAAFATSGCPALASLTFGSQLLPASIAASGISRLVLAMLLDLVGRDNGIGVALVAREHPADASLTSRGERLGAGGIEVIASDDFNAVGGLENMGQKTAPHLRNHESTAIRRLEGGRHCGAAGRDVVARINERLDLCVIGVKLRHFQPPVVTTFQYTP